MKIVKCIKKKFAFGRIKSLEEELKEKDRKILELQKKIETFEKHEEEERIRLKEKEILELGEDKILERYSNNNEEVSAYEYDFVKRVYDLKVLSERVVDSRLLGQTFVTLLKTKSGKTFYIKWGQGCGSVDF